MALLTLCFYCFVALVYKAMHNIHLKIDFSQTSWILDQIEFCIETHHFFLIRI